MNKVLTSVGASLSLSKLIISQMTLDYSDILDLTFFNLYP